MGRNESPEVTLLSLQAPPLTCTEPGRPFLFSRQRKKDASVSRQPDPTPDVRIEQVAGDPGVTVLGYDACARVLCFEMELGQREEQK